MRSTVVGSRAVAVAERSMRVKRAVWPDQGAGSGHERGFGADILPIEAPRIEGDGAALDHIAAVRAVALPKQDVAGSQDAGLGREGDEAQRFPVEQAQERRPRQDPDVVLEGHGVHGKGLMGRISGRGISGQRISGRTQGGSEARTQGISL